ncbi:MAG: hypothetical protein H6838_06770 [Planctomycetes bacterium]|nr:hypothetical protein [Planctomycetota bacterium]
MLRKSLQVLAAAVLLVLLLTVGYIVLLGGPERALDRADKLFARGDYLGVVADLNLAWRGPSLRADRALRHRLWRRRYEAYRKLGNNPGALEDLEQLLAEKADGAEALRLDHIRLLAVVGQGQRALQLAEAYLVDHPGDGRALELAGEAAQTLYQEELRRVRDTIRRAAGRRDEAAARADLLSYLYRPDGDERIPLALAALGAIYRNNSQLLASWPTLQKDLINLRGRIQDCLARFRASLEADGEPVAAFRALCLSLDQAERTDDLLLFCEAYRRRFDHQYVIEAGSFATWALVRREQYVAALATADRWLPPAAVAALLENKQFATGLNDFLLARTLAAHRLGNTAALRRFAKETYELSQAGAAVPLAQAFTGGLVQNLNGNRDGAEDAMRYAAILALRTGVPVGQVDLLPVIMPLRIDLLQRRAAPLDEVIAVHQEWTEARPGELQPLLALADYQLRCDRLPAAAATMAKALDLAPFEEAVLERRLAVARAQYRDSDQDGPGLLAQCLRRKDPLPETSDPLGYLLCAEAALAENDPRLAPVALACARAAVDRFVWSRRPRVLEARAELLAGRPLAAVTSLDKLLLRGDHDPQTLYFLLQARRGAGLPANDVVIPALATLPPNAVLAAATLRSVPATALAQAEPFARKALRFVAEDPDLGPLCAAVFAAVGDRAAADQLLEPLRHAPGERTAQQVHELATAVLTRLTAPPLAEDAALAAATERDLADYGLRVAAAADAVVATATRLGEDRPGTALALLSAGLASGGPDSRSGAAFAMAGDLALRAGQLRLAEQHFTAALAFEDGGAAVEPLARLCLADGRSQRAAQVYALLQTPTDLGLALRFGQRTPRSPAEILARQRLEHDHTDLLGHIAVAALGLPSAADLDLQAAPLLDSLFEVMALCDTPELVATAVPQAEALVAAAPDSRCLRLLQSQVLLGAGQASAAAPIHSELFATETGKDDALLLGEVARATLDPSYPVPAPLAEAVRQAVAKGQLTNCPAATAFAMRFAAQTVEQAGHRDLAERLATDMWVALPIETGATLETAERVAARGNAQAAWWILERLSPSLTTQQIPVALDRQVALARTVLATDTKLAALFYDAALRAIAQHGPRGSLVHFVLDQAPNLPDRALGTERTRELLAGHLELAAAAATADPTVTATVRRLTALVGSDAALTAVAAALAHNPTCLQLWVARTTLLRRGESSNAPVQELRNVLTNGVDAPTRLQFTVLAARSFDLQAADAVDLVSLPAEVRNSPEGMFATGFALLRAGNANQALPLLRRSPKRDDGLQLVALALAELQGNDPQGAVRAAAILAALETDYPSSSLAKNAGSLARQLAPRSASAAPSPTNR